MTQDNIYAPTTVDLTAPIEGAPNFYVVSKTKLIVLFVATMGLYTVYWSYKNWQIYKEATGYSAWPVLRGIFPYFFMHSLYRSVDGKINASGRSYPWSPSTLATSFVAVLLIDKVLDRMVAKGAGYPFTDIASLVLVPVMIMILLPAQRAINFAENDPDGESNSKFTALNYLWIVIGAAAWVLVAIGMFIPE